MKVYTLYHTSYSPDFTLYLELDRHIFFDTSLFSSDISVMFVSCILVIERIASPVPFLQEALSSSLQFETLNWEAVKWTEILLAALRLWTLHYSIVDDSHSVFYFVVAKIFSFFCARSWCCMYHPSFTYQPRRRGQLQFTKSNVQHSNTQRFTYGSHQFIVGGAEFFFRGQWKLSCFSFTKTR